MPDSRRAAALLAGACLLSLPETGCRKKPAPAQPPPARYADLSALRKAGLERGFWPEARGDSWGSNLALFPGPKSPRLKWTLRVIDGIERRSTLPKLLVGGEGTVYVETMEVAASTDELHGTAFVAAVDSSGKKRWKHPFGAPPLGDMLLGLDGTVYVVPDPGTDLHALSPQGELLWTRRICDKIYSLSMRPDGDLHLVGADRSPQTGSLSASSLYRVSKDGKVERVQTALGPVTSRFLIGPGGEKFFLADGSPGRFLIAWGPDDRETWRKQLSSPYSALLFLASKGDRLMAADVQESGATSLLALGLDGAKRWARSFPAQSVLLGTCAGMDGEVYAALMNDRTGKGGFSVKAFNAEGREKWTYTPDEMPYPGWDLMADADGTVYVQADDINKTTLHAVRRGKLKWRLVLPGDGRIGGVFASGKDGAIYLVTYKGLLHCVAGGR
ncbi:MAG: hypothetical protein HY922_02315 [Elusimicrobia bacterium]|nr:hypothetical protein [Elusimicrobiota bacterium]